jgi:NTP pyrophosphatase (non-canonical NTP hydrolase)
MKYEQEVIQWALDKGIITPDNAKSQLLKSFEEMGEVARAVLKNNQEELIDGLGDVLVTLIILAEIKGVKLEDCLGSAYNVIKNRTGKTVNGTFIKNE